MTENARIVLQDAKFAISYHKPELQSERFRISWISVVTLLRAVGHVLKNVDCKTSLAMKTAIESKWEQLQATKPEPTIFWKFIVEERNRFLKNYQHSISRHLIFDGPVHDGEKSIITADVSNSRGGTFGDDKPTSSVISDGHFKGRNEREVAWVAHDWWLEYLDEVDELAELHS